ncbi:Hpt domain-containing protein [Vibrio algarum]|uniref:hypothetical protein n=1 Tax=Vibrio algarum TaxID=3020714 RepID=UPI00389A9B0B
MVKYAHKIKGSASMIGNSKMVTIASNLQDERDSDKTVLLKNVLINELHKTLDVVNGLLMEIVYEE